MLGRKQIDNPINQGVAPARSSLVDVAWSVEERIVWGGADVIRAALAAVRRPFERLAWASEERLIWPLQERTDHWSAPLRAAVAAAVAAIAVAAVIGGALLAKGSGSERPAPVEQAASVAPAPAPAPSRPAPVAPALQGATPDFTPEAAGGAGKGAAAAKATSHPSSSPAAVESTAAGTSALPESAASTPAPNATAAKPGPAATKVVRKFAGAFVLYETGRGDPAALRSVFAETTTPQFARQLLKRPPRLPADVKVPQAKVLNVVAGPAQADNTFTYSISLLRLGVTSELRVDIQRNEKSGKWQVTEALG
jgi:hypothetical protein